MTKKEEEKNDGVNKEEKEAAKKNEATAKTVKQVAEKIAESADSAEETIAHEAKSKKCGKPIVKYAAIVVMILVIAGLLLTRGNQLIAEPFVKSQLDRVSKNLTSEAALSGDIASFTHGDITITGSMFNKQAIIKDLELDYTASLPFGNQQRTVISTHKAVVMADQIEDSTIVIAFPEPFVLERNGGPPLELRFDGKPVYKFSSDAGVEQHDLTVPSTLVMAMNPGNEEDPIEVTATYASAPTLSRTVDYNNQKRSSTLSVADILLTSNVESNEISIGNLSLDSKEKALEENKRQFSNVLMVEGVQLKKLDVVDGPYNLTANLYGDYLAQPNEQGNVEISQVHMNIEDFAFSSEHYSIGVQGQFSRAPEDQMIFGVADISIAGLDKLKQSELIGVKDEALKNKVIALITGNSDPALTEANFTLKREKHGTFFVGETTFENLIGVVVTHALSQTQEQLVPPVQAVQPVAPETQPTQSQ